MSFDRFMFHVNNPGIVGLDEDSNYIHFMLDVYVYRGDAHDTHYCRIADSL